MKAAGFARGGSLDNAVVVDDFCVQNPDRLRYPDEFVRHEVLDALDDLSPLAARLRSASASSFRRQSRRRVGRALRLRLRVPARV